MSEEPEKKIYNSPPQKPLEVKRDGSDLVVLVHEFPRKKDDAKFSPDTIEAVKTNGTFVIRMTTYRLSELDTKLGEYGTRSVQNSPPYTREFGGSMWTREGGIGRWRMDVGRSTPEFPDRVYDAFEMLNKSN